MSAPTAATTHAPTRRKVGRPSRLNKELIVQAAYEIGLEKGAAFPSQEVRDAGFKVDVVGDQVEVELAEGQSIQYEVVNNRGKESAENLKVS